jgi:hypothetical protein
MIRAVGRSSWTRLRDRVDEVRLAEPRPAANEERVIPSPSAAGRRDRRRVRELVRRPHDERRERVLGVDVARRQRDAAQHGGRLDRGLTVGEKAGGGGSLTRDDGLVWIARGRTGWLVAWFETGALRLGSMVQATCTLQPESSRILSAIEGRKFALTHSRTNSFCTRSESTPSVRSSNCTAANHWSKVAGARPRVCSTARLNIVRASNLGIVITTLEGTAQPIPEIHS